MKNLFNSNDKNMLHWFFALSCTSRPILILLFLHLQLVTCQNGQIQSEFRITKVANCETMKELKWLMQNVKIYSQYPSTFLSVSFNVTEDIRKLTKIKMHLDRCNDEGFDCEDFQTWNINDFCILLNMRGQVWSSFVDSIHPQFRCPIKKTIYEVRNTSFDLSTLVKWYPEFVKYRWKSTTKFWNEKDSIVFCGIFEAHVYQYRKRDRKPSRNKP